MALTVAPFSPADSAGDSRAQRLFLEGQDLHRRGRIEGALQRYELAIAEDPAFPPARIFRAIILQRNGLPLQALEEAERALDCMGHPDPGILINYGVIQKNAGRLDRAAQAYERALELNPGLRSAQANLATIYLIQGRLDEAEQRFLDLTERMEEAAPWLNLARIALLRQRHDDARRCLERAADHDSSHPDLCLLKARLELQLRNDEEAFAACIEGLRRAPAHGELWQQLQMLEARHFDLDAVEERLLELSRLEVNSATVLSVAVDLCRKNWLWRPLPVLERRLAASLLQPLDRSPSVADVFTLLGAAIPQRAHLGAASRCWATLTAAAVPLEPVAPRPLDRSPLRVGILSSDLRGHAIGHLVVGLLEHLPHGRIEWWAYHNAFDDSSSVRERLRDPFDRSVNVARLESAELARRIRDDGIDVLIDFNQMTAMTRVEVMAWRPAPLQIQWLGMPGSLGAGDAVDYVIVDPWVVDAANADGFSECLLQLPRSYQPNDHTPPDLELCPNRGQAGLPAEGVVFGVFNQPYKFSPDTFALWARILQQCPGAWLWLLDPGSDGLRQRMRHQLSCHGINPERLLLAPHLPQDEHLARLRWLDLMLDTWPYNAHTTCSDALRAGVPVLTLPGATFAARVASGILATAGLESWIAADAADYVARAVAFGQQDRTAIDACKSGIARTYWSSRMVDNARFGRELEALLLGLHGRALAGKAPTSLRLTDALTMEPLPWGRQADDDPSPGSECPPGPGQPDVNAQGAASVGGSGRAEQPPWNKRLYHQGPQARLANLAILAREVIGLEQPQAVLEVGPPPGGDGDELQPLLAAGLLQGRRLAPEQLGDGGPASCHRHQAADLDSCLPLRHDWLARFPGYGRWGRLLDTEPVSTSRLDDLVDTPPLRLLRGDCRGRDIMVFSHGEHCLAGLAMLELKTAPTALHAGGTSLFTLGSWLAERGFVLHTFRRENRRLFLPAGTEANPYAGRHQLLQLDAVFIPDPLRWREMNRERLLALAFLAHALHRSTDLTMHVLDSLDRRGGGDRLGSYRTYLDRAGIDG